MPRTLAQNAQYIAETIKPAIKSAIEAQGVTVPSTDSFLDYADRIGEIEGGGSGYQLKDLPTGSISTVNDAAELPLNALKISVEAVQSGSGDPSPSNIRPIHGWDSVAVEVVGKNEALMAQGEVTSDGSDSLTNIRIRNVGYIKVIIGQAYTLSCTSNTNRQCVVRFFANQNEEERSNSDWQSMPYTFTVPQDTRFVRFMLRKTIPPYEIRPSDVDVQFELGTTATTYEPYQGKQYTLDFPTTIYGAEWDVVSGGMKQTDGYIASYNGENLPSSWISDRDVYDGTNTPTIGAEVAYKLATPTTIDLSPLAIRLLEGVNNLYADCGEVLEGEYFIDEGAIDVRKVDYSIGSNSALKISDGRIIQGFANMNGYHARPLDASGNWLDVDWSKDWEIGSAFKASSLSGNTTIFGCGVSGSMNYAPNVYFYQGSTAYITLSEDGSSSAIDTALNYTFRPDTWYFVRAKFTKSTLNLKIEVSTDMSNFTTAYNDTLASAPYHDSASICIGGMAQSANYASNSILIDLYNTYIKDDSGSIVWGASTEAFPS